MKKATSASIVPWVFATRVRLFATCFCTPGNVPTDVKAANPPSLPGTGSRDTSLNTIPNTPPLKKYGKVHPLSPPRLQAVNKCQRATTVAWFFSHRPMSAGTPPPRSRSLRFNPIATPWKWPSRRSFKCPSPPVGKLAAVPGSIPKWPNWPTSSKAFESHPGIKAVFHLKGNNFTFATYAVASTSTKVFCMYISSENAHENKLFFASFDYGGNGMHEKCLEG